jgi:hypothetical protein
MAAEPQPSATDPNVEAYNAQRTQLEAEHLGEYIAIANGGIVGLYPSFDEAWRAVETIREKLVFQIGDKPYLAPVRISSGIRKLGPVIGE